MPLSQNQIDEIFASFGDEPNTKGGQRTTSKGGGDATAPADERLPRLPFVNMSAWDSVAPPARQWLIVDYIPLRQVTLLSGTGGIGKSVLALQLLAASALRREWFGTLFPKPGAGIYLGAEDEQDEIHRRLAAILSHYHSSFADLTANGFRALAFAGKDAVLATFDRDGRLKVTNLFRALYAEAVKLQPSTIVIDTAADTHPARPDTASSGPPVMFATATGSGRARSWSGSSSTARS
jgi:RecA-family ATPase